MGEKLTVSIALYGIIETNADRWLAWYEFCTKYINELGFSPNFIGIVGDSFKSGKILSINRASKRLRRSIDSNEQITSLEVYSLPFGFKQAAFDYEIYLSRSISKNNSYVLMTLSKDLYNKINKKQTLEMLSKHISFDTGEIFEMSNLECPQFYAARVNSLSSYKTLNVIEQL